MGEIGSDQERLQKSRRRARSGSHFGLGDAFLFDSQVTAEEHHFAAYVPQNQLLRLAHLLLYCGVCTERLTPG